MVRVISLLIVLATAASFAPNLCLKVRRHVLSSSETSDLEADMAAASGNPVRSSPAPVQPLLEPP